MKMEYSGLFMKKMRNVQKTACATMDKRIAMG